MRIRIRMFLGLPDPDQLVRRRDQIVSTGIVRDQKHKNSKENLDSYYFVTSLWIILFKNDVNVASKSNKQKNLEKNYL